MARADTPAPGSAILVNGDSAPAHLRGGVVAIGNFDGVHRGHQALLAVARDEAERRGVPWGVVTFEPHPRTVFRPDEPVFRLTPAAMKARLLLALGARFVSQLTFDKDLAGLEAQDFVQLKLIAALGVCHVVTGFDFHFGKGRKGNPETMRALGAAHGFGVTIVDQVTDDDGVAPFSSSATRAGLRRGHVANAASQLGYWWTVAGEVVRGDRRGRTIGFPTANIVLDAGCEPHNGIYAVRVRLDGEDRVRAGAGYIGRRPTFDTDRVFLEVFIFDFDADIYGAGMAVEFIKCIRHDRKFRSVAELVSQMKIDCANIRTVLDETARHDPVKEFPLGALQAAGKL